jgi:hypothetical protein
MCDEVVGVLSAKNQAAKAVSSFIKDAIYDISRQPFTLGREQFDIGVIELE